jgi:regulator of sigma D
MKTAMQELTDYMKTYFHLTDESLEMFDEALEKEKEQMLNFYMWMRMNENTEKYLDYSDEDMFKEYLNQDK